MWFNGKHLSNCQIGAQNDFVDLVFLTNASDTISPVLDFCWFFQNFPSDAKLFKIPKYCIALNMEGKIDGKLLQMLWMFFPQSTIKLFLFHVATTSHHLTFCSQGNYSCLPLNIKASYYSSLYLCIYLFWQVSKAWFFSLLQIKLILM